LKTSRLVRKLIKSSSLQHCDNLPVGLILILPYSSDTSLLFLVSLVPPLFVSLNTKINKARGAVGRVSQSCGAVGRMTIVWSRGPHDNRVEPWAARHVGINVHSNVEPWAACKPWVCILLYMFLIFEGSSFIALEGAVYTSEGKYFFFSLLLLLFTGGVAFYFTAHFSCGSSARFSSTLRREAALSSLRREFFSKHYVLGGSVEVPILQSILWPFYQDKVLPTTTLSPLTASVHYCGLI